jgi:soluble lytic murein transglycosylase
VVKELIILLALLLGNRWTVAQLAQNYDVSPRLAACIVSYESNWDPKLIMRAEDGFADDEGLFQIIPDTAEWVAGKLGYTEWDMSDPIQNAEFGVYILKHFPEWYSTLPWCEE